MINRQPGSLGPLLGALPFLLLLFVYLIVSQVRLDANPEDKLTPSPDSLYAGWASMALYPDKRSETRLFWVDTQSSLTRIGIGLGIATLVALVAGTTLGMIPIAGSLFTPLVAVLSMIPALSILPILFIVFGVGEFAKVALIVIGVLPFMTRDLSQRVGELPDEQLIKAQTLGASSWQIALRVVLPQALPRLIDSLRLALGPAWLFLISAEAISATSGLGYRIFLVRRYLAMDVILPYVAWITFLAFMLDWLLRWARDRYFPWIDEDAP